METEIRFFPNFLQKKIFFLQKMKINSIFFLLNIDK